MNRVPLPIAPPSDTMRDNLDDIADFYSQDPEQEHGRLLINHLEFALTMRLLKRFLPPNRSILDVGTGTGRYAFELSNIGHRVTALDLSPGLIKKAVEVYPNAPIRFLVADARDLSLLGEERFDAVLLLGPLYHLVTEFDRREVLSQAYNKLVHGGIIVSAFISRLGILGDLIRKNPGWIEDHAHVRSFLEHGHRPDDAEPGGFRGYFAQVDEIAPLHQSAGFEMLALAGIEPAISADDESFNRLTPDNREQWLDVFEEICEAPSIVGASRHILYVGRKQ